MNTRKTEMIVGLFAIVIFILLTFMTFKVGEFTIGKKPGYVVYAYFRDTAGLYEQTKVKIAGVDAGTLEKIALINGVAQLTLRMDTGVTLYSDASAGIRTTGLLGDKFLEVKVGSTPPVLKDGDTITNIEEFIDIDDMFQNLDDLAANVNQVVATLNEPDTKNAFRDSVKNLRDITESLKTVITGNEDRLDRILARIDSLTGSLDDLVAENKAPLSNTISNFEEFSASLKEDGPGLVSDLNETVAEIKSVIQENREEISSTMDSVNSVAQKIDRGEGTIGKLVNDDSLYVNLTNAVGGISNTISGINRFRTFITFRGEYLERLQDGKGGFYLTLQPREDKYYILGVVGDPIGKVDVTDTYVNGTRIHEEEVQTDIEFTAQFAKRFNNTALRIGLVESSFGVGLDQFFLDDKLRLYADAWDFETDEYLAEDAHLNVGADYFIFKNFFISGGVDNILNSHRTGAFFGAGVRFEDEDFKYLFGTGLPNVAK
jgi:phospholipid/cholesterol/gamma-HCH transport system substrate-binding protein